MKCEQNDPEINSQMRREKGIVSKTEQLHRN